MAVQLMQRKHMALLVGVAMLGSAAVGRAAAEAPPCTQMDANAPGNLIQNGSFEAGRKPGGYLTLNPGSAAIKYWSVIRGGIDYYGTGWVASDGHRSLDLNGTPGVGGVAQTFATIPGQKYRVCFDMAGHPSGLLQTMKVSAAGQAQDFTFQSGADQNHLGWERRTWEFTANAPNTTLEFYSLQTDYEYGGPALDNVYVASAEQGSQESAHLRKSGLLQVPVVLKGVGCGVGLIPAGSLVGKFKIVGFVKRADDVSGYIALVKDVRAGHIIRVPLRMAQLIPHEKCVEAIVDLLAPGQLEALEQCLAASTPAEQLCLQNILDQVGLHSPAQAVIPPGVTPPEPAPTPTPPTR